MANWTCGSCDRDNTARVKACVHCGATRAPKEIAPRVGPSLRVTCSWKTHARTCLMPAELEFEGRRLCGWHHHVLGNARLGREDFEAWIGLLGRVHTCSIWRHLPVGELWALMAGEETFPGSEPAYCGEPGCAFEPDPAEMDPREAMQRVRVMTEDFPTWERKERLRAEPGILERRGLHDLRPATRRALRADQSLSAGRGSARQAELARPR